jgi:hypothetical protein
MSDQAFIDWIGTLPDEVIKDNFKLVVKKLKEIYSPGKYTLGGQPMSIKYSIDFPKNEEERLHFYIQLTTPKTLTKNAAKTAFLKNIEFFAKAPQGSNLNMGNMSKIYNIISLFSLHIPNVLKKGERGIIHTKLGNNEHLLRIQFVNPHIGFQLDNRFSYNSVPLYHKDFTKHIIDSFNEQFFAIIEVSKAFAKMNEPGAGTPLSPLVVPAARAAQIVARPAPLSPLVVPAARAAQIVPYLHSVVHSPLVTNGETNKTRKAYRNRAYELIHGKGGEATFGEARGYTNERLAHMHQVLEEDPEKRFEINWKPNIRQTVIRLRKGGARRRRITRKN